MKKEKKGREDHTGSVGFNPAWFEITTTTTFLMFFSCISWYATTAIIVDVVATQWKIFGRRKIV